MECDEEVINGPRTECLHVGRLSVRGFWSVAKLLPTRSKLIDRWLNRCKISCRVGVRGVNSVLNSDSCEFYCIIRFCMGNVLIDLYLFFLPQKQFGWIC